MKQESQGMTICVLYALLITTLLYKPSNYHLEASMLNMNATVIALLGLKTGDVYHIFLYVRPQQYSATQLYKNSNFLDRLI